MKTSLGGTRAHIKLEFMASPGGTVLGLWGWMVDLVACFLLVFFFCFFPAGHCCQMLDQKEQAVVVLIQG